MKLVAIKTFLNNKNTAALVDGKPGPELLEKGTDFTIGTTDVLADLSENEKERLWMLVRAAKVAVLDEPDNAALIKKIKAEAVAEKAAEKASLESAKRAAQPAEERIASAVLETVMKALSAAGVLKKA